MKNPGLGVQPCQRGVVGDADLGAKGSQFIESALLSAIRIGRRQHPQSPASLHMPTKTIGQIPNTTPANERHQHVDAIS
jgi:hypothetical protein